MVDDGSFGDNGSDEIYGAGHVKLERARTLPSSFVKFSPCLHSAVTTLKGMASKYPRLAFS